jgi:hypothetical protein
MTGLNDVMHFVETGEKPAGFTENTFHDEDTHHDLDFEDLGPAVTDTDK